MKLRGLEAIDPLSVPLPNGTEVTTRVDRAAGDHLVKRGAVGRVVGAAAGHLDVNVLGVGVVRYLREELVPRKLGHMRFAHRREHAWSALSACVVVEAVVGSRAWGLADAGSDTDRRGIFALPLSWTTGLVEPPLDLVSADGSTTYWEVEKAIRQALKADPNTLEVLFVDGVRATDEIGAWILDARDAFASREIYGSFGRYALSQLKRLGQSQRLARHRALLHEWLAREPSLTLDEVAARLADAAGIVAPTAAAARRRAKDYVKQLYRSMYDQGLLPSRDFAALVEHARRGGAVAEGARELRPKNAYNLVRLIDAAIRWLETGRAELRVREPLASRLRAIKAGDVALDEVLADAEARTRALEAARDRSPLPERPDVGRADALLRRIRAELARRAVVGDAGPFGAGAPELPLASYEEDAT